MTRSVTSSYAACIPEALFITKRLARQLMSSSPATQDSRSSLVIKTCSCSFVPGFTFVLMLVLVLAWNGCAVRFMAALGVVFVCMASMFVAPFFPVHVQLLRSRT